MESNPRAGSGLAQTESQFSIEELFFSRTDAHGIIKAGNEVFVRVSSFERDELLEQPHNLIRHPDMPKSVFRLFWRVVQSGKLIVAYVKNRAKDGRYYWVLATAFPVKGGYLSIRMKPSGALFDAVRAIYAEMLALEKSKGLDAAEQLLIERLAAAGFPDYESFMRKALSEVLRLRDRATTLESFEERALDPRLARSQNQCRIAAIEFRSAFDRICAEAERGAEFRRNSESILRVHSRIHFLSLNMTVESEHIGEQGRTLSVAARTFSSWSGEIQNAIEEFSRVLELVNRNLTDLEFSASASRCQVEMADYFMDEFSRGKDRGESAYAELVGSCSYFFAAPDAVFADMGEKLRRTRECMRLFIEATERVRTALNALRLIRQNARIEVARLPQGADGFLNHLDQMSSFTQEIETALTRLMDSTRTMTGSVDDIQNRIRKVENAFRQAAQELRPAAEDRAA